MFDPKVVRLLSWNADGVRSKIQELLDLAVCSVPVDIITVCETRLTNNIPLLTPGFVCYRKDKHDSGRGQGVAILVKQGIEHSVINIPPTINIEVVGISLNISGVVHVIVSAYQSPNLPLVPSDLDVLLNLSNHLIIAGDFNANHDHWLSSYTNTRGRVLFHHMLNNDYFIFAPSIPTHIHYSVDNNPTNPDLVICQNIDKISHVDAIIALSSNHYPIYFTVGGSLTFKQRHVFCYSRANWPLYRSIINENISLTSGKFGSVDSIDNAVDHLQKLTIMARNRAIPLRVTRGCTSKLPRYIKRLISYKNYLRGLDTKLPKGQLKRSIRYVINSLCATISIEMTNHSDKMWNDRLCKVDNPSNDIWRLAQTLKPKSHKIPPLMYSDGTMTSSEAEQCEVLANAFLGNMSLTVNSTISDFDSKIKENVVKIERHSIVGIVKPVRPTEIRKILKTLKLRKSPSNDEITNSLLKHYPTKAIVFLSLIFNSCLSLGYFPDMWKKAKVIALKKSGKNDVVPTNYRPISLLPSLGKLFEKIIYARLLAVSKHRIMNEQFGFRSKHSCIQQLARVTEHIAHNLNLRQSTGMFLLDIEKAFDTVWHDGLLHKLVNLDIPLDLVKLIKSYLTNRTFSVSIGNTQSSNILVPAGVPQGSILGPYLFILYLSDMPVQHRTNLACFADDTASYTSSNDVDLIISRLQFSLELLFEYFTRWKLKLNESKTQAILFTRQRQLPERSLKIGCYAIPWSRSVRYLGITLDSKLNWTKHIMNLRTKGAQALGALSPIMNRNSKLSSKTKMRIYSTLVRPCITYACPVWSSTCLTNYQFLQVVQNRALKIAYNTPWKTNLFKLHLIIKYPVLIQFILNITKKFYTKNKQSNNPLISNICKTSTTDLSYIDRYRTYRLPHHYLLFPPGDITQTGAQAHDRPIDTRDLALTPLAGPTDARRGGQGSPHRC